MSENLNLDDKLIIIKNAGMEDVEILDYNYKHMLQDTTDPEEKLEIVILRSNVLDRMKELSGDK
jgi:hypothetical protein